MKKQPSRPHRISVPVTPEVLAKFERFSKVSGLSVSKSIGDWLRDTVQGLDAMVDILETHKSRPAQAMDMLGRYAAALQDMTDSTITKMKQPQPHREGDPLAGKSLDAAKAAMFKAAKVKISITPPSSNTGGYRNISTTSPKGSKS